MNQELLTLSERLSVTYKRYVVFSGTLVSSTNKTDLLDILLKVTLNTITSLLEHMRSPPVFSGVCVIRSLVSCVMLCGSFFPFCPFVFGHCVFYPSIDLRILITPFISSSSSFMSKWCIGGFTMSRSYAYSVW